MTYILRLLHCRHTVEYLLLEHPVAGIGVDGEISHTKRCQVLEEVRSLRWIHVIVLQSRLHDDSRCRDMRPLHWYTQPVVR